MRVRNCVVFKLLLVASIAFWMCAAQVGASEDTDKNRVEELLKSRGLHTGVPQKGIDEGTIIRIDDAVRIAIDNTPRVKAAIAEVGITTGERRSEAAAENPLIEAAHDETAIGRGAITFTARQDVTSLLFALLRTTVVEKAKREAALAAAEKILSLIGDVKQAYIMASAQQSIVELDARQKEAAYVAMLMAGRQLKAGNINELDNRLFVAEWHRLTAEYEHSLTALGIAHGELKTVIGLQARDSLLILDTLASPPPLNTGDDQLTTMALERRFDIATFVAQKERLQAQQRSIRMESFGGIEAGLETHYENGTLGNTYPVAGVRLPLFNRNAGKRQMVKFSLQKTEYEIEALRREIPTLVKTATNEYKRRSAEALLRDTIALEQAAILELVQRHYNVMTMGVYDLLAAKRLEINARREWIISLRDAWISLVNLELVIGEDIRLVQK